MKTRWVDVFGTPHRPIWTAPADGQRPAHGLTQAFYAGLPDNVRATVDHRPALLEFADALLFVADHPGWRLRKIQGEWRAVR